MGEPQGFMAPGLVRGTIVYMVLGFIASFVAQAFVKETPNITKSESRRLSLVIVWTSTVCMWLLWACVYMHQMVPLIKPIHYAM